MRVIFKLILMDLSVTDIVLTMLKYFPLQIKVKKSGKCHVN